MDVLKASRFIFLKTSFSSVWEHTFVYGPLFQFHFCWKITQQMLCFPLLFSKLSVFSSSEHFVFWAVFPKQLNKETIWLPNKSCNLLAVFQTLAGWCLLFLCSLCEGKSEFEWSQTLVRDGGVMPLVRQATNSVPLGGRGGSGGGWSTEVTHVTVNLFICDLKTFHSWSACSPKMAVPIRAHQSAVSLRNELTSRVMWAQKSLQKERGCEPGLELAMPEAQQRCISTCCPQGYRWRHGIVFCSLF